MPLRSMTAFGSGESQSPTFSYTCEMKSLNSRFLEVNVRLPRFLAMLETEIVKFMKDKLDRGKVDMFFDIRSQDVSATLPKVNDDAVKHYISCAEQIAKAANLPSDDKMLSVSQILRLEGVLELERHSSSSQEVLDQHREFLMKAINSGVEQLIQDREREGASLVSSLSSHLDVLENQMQEIAAMVPGIREKLEVNFHKKIEAARKSLQDKGLLGDSDVSQERLTSELVIAADKIDIAEEIDRLGAHIVEFRKQMGAGDKIGRRLDFLCQEMHREINTLSNKLVAAEVSKISVAMKQNVERVKQQVQNIE